MSTFIPQLAGEACQLGCPKIVLDHMRVYIHVYIYYSMAESVIWQDIAVIAQVGKIFS